MSLDCFAIGGGALRVGRIFNRYRHSWCRGILGTLDGDEYSRVTLGVCRRSCCEMDGCLM